MKLVDVPEMGYLHTDRVHGSVTEKGQSAMYYTLTHISL